MQNLITLWGVALKPFLAQSDDGMVVLIQTQANNGFYVGQVMSTTAHGYISTTQNTIVLRGDESIWTLI